MAGGGEGRGDLATFYEIGAALFSVLLWIRSILYVGPGPRVRHTGKRT